MTDTPRRFPLLPALAIAFAVLVWGGSFVAARHLLEPGAPDRGRLDPVTLAAARFTLASLFLAAPFAAAVIRRKVSGRDLLRMALLGQIAFSVYFWLQYTGVRNTNAGLSSILAVGLLPAATAVLAPLGGEERPGARAWAALLLGFLGVVAIAMEKPIALSGERSFLLGALCLTANAFAFAVYSLLNRRWMKSVSPMALTGGAMIFGALGLLAMSLAWDRGGWMSLRTLDGGQWGALLFLVLCCSVGGYFAWTYALGRIEASRAAVCIYAEPVVAVALGAALLGERYGPAAFGGAAAIALSVALATRRKPPAKSEMAYEPRGVVTSKDL